MNHEFVSIIIKTVVASQACTQGMTFTSAHVCQSKGTAAMLEVCLQTVVCGIIHQSKITVCELPDVDVRIFAFQRK